MYERIEEAPHGQFVSSADGVVKPESSASATSDTRSTTQPEPREVVFQTPDPDLSRASLKEVLKLIDARILNLDLVLDGQKTFGVGEDDFRVGDPSCGSLDKQIYKYSAVYALILDQELELNYSKAAYCFEPWFLERERCLGLPPTEFQQVLVSDGPIPQYAVSRQVRNHCAHTYGVPGLGGYDASRVWVHVQKVYPQLKKALEHRLAEVERILAALPEEVVEVDPWALPPSQEVYSWEGESSDEWADKWDAAPNQEDEGYASQGDSAEEDPVNKW